MASSPCGCDGAPCAEAVASFNLRIIADSRGRHFDLNQDRPAALLQHFRDFFDAILAARCDSGIILFCGVQFVAEAASILAPACTVLIPDAGAGCILALDGFGTGRS